jgi:hypothetical protein
MGEIHVPVTWSGGIRICTMAEGYTSGNEMTHSPGRLERRWEEQLRTGETKLIFIEWLRRER